MIFLASPFGPGCPLYLFLANSKKDAASIPDAGVPGIDSRRCTKSDSATVLGISIFQQFLKAF